MRGVLIFVAESRTTLKTDAPKICKFAKKRDLQNAKFFVYFKFLYTRDLKLNKA